ncbi:Uncharacterized protein SLP1 [Spathaspora sp. JA1]|nr:Uncharacterized protein SLP1 [Spathaspora sp. JA1]
MLRCIVWFVLCIEHLHASSITSTTIGLSRITSTPSLMQQLPETTTERLKSTAPQESTTPSSKSSLNSKSKGHTQSTSTSQEISPVKPDIPVFETSISFVESSITVQSSGSDKNTPTGTTIQSISSSKQVSSDIQTKISNTPSVSTGLLKESKNSSNLHPQLLPSPVENNTIMDNVHFMSFEEWKKHKIIEKNNQTISSSSVKVAASSASAASSTGSSSVSISVEGLNDTNSTANSNKTSMVNLVNGTATVQVKKKETEGKVYKDKFNYASVDCAATIVKTNANAKSASSILKENKDSYLLNQCSNENKFVVIELCQDILVDVVVIGNFEFFSSMFKDVRISVSDRFPTQNWKILGEFTAKNIRDVQNFKITNPLIWARYLRLEILSHYGNEFYCPISVVRVHGKTMMEEFKEDTEQEKQQQQQQEVPKRDEPLSSSILMINQTSNECPIVMPHLKLNAFLKDINKTQEYCLPESEPTTSIVTTQESVYKNIMKRLSLLESNATLSLLYIEEQSKLLSNAFTNLEKRQTSNFNDLITSVNITLINQLTSFKEAFNSLQDQYEKFFQMNQQTLIYDSQQKISNLTSELTFQKRVTMFNSIIIICLLVYVILTRDTYIDVQDDNNTPVSSPFKPFKPFKKISPAKRQINHKKT